MAIKAYSPYDDEEYAQAQETNGQSKGQMDANAPDAGAPPKPQPYQPTTNQQSGKTGGDGTPYRPPTFTQLQDAGEARPPMPVPVAPPAPVTAQPQQNPGVQEYTGPQVNQTQYAPPVVQQGGQLPAPSTVRFGDQPALSGAAGGLASYAPQGGVGHFSGQAGGRVFNEQGEMVDPTQLPPGRLTPEALQRLQAGMSVRLQDGGGATYINTTATDPNSLSFGLGDGTVQQPGQGPASYQQTAGNPALAAAYAAMNRRPVPAGLAMEGGEVLTSMAPGAQQRDSLLPERSNMPTSFPGFGNGGVQAAGPDSIITSYAPATGGQGQPQGTPDQTTTAQGPSSSNNILDLLMGGAGQKNNAYGTDQVKNSYDWLGGQIDDDFALQQGKLGEEMARRGLGASTIYGGRLNDLNIGKRSAKESLAYDLADKQASFGNQAQSNQLDWLKSLMGYGQQGFENDMTTARFDADQNNNYQDYILKLLGMGG